MCPIDLCSSFWFWVWLRVGGCFGLWFWCGGVNSSNSLTSTKMLFIIGQVFGRCTNILRDFHRRLRLKGKKTSDAQCRHEDLGAQSEILPNLDESRRNEVQKLKLPYNRHDTVLKARKFTLTGKMGEISPRSGSFK